MKVYAVILFVSFTIAPILADEVVANSTCPAVPVAGSFNESAYAGNWFEIKRFPNTLVSDTCSNPVFTWGSNKFNVTYANNPKSSYELRPQLPPNGPIAGKYDIYKGTEKDSIAYQVVLTDYKQFSLVWGCKVVNGTKSIQRVFIYSRTTTLKSENFVIVNATLTGYGIDVKQLKDVEQADAKCGRGGGAIVLPSLISGIIIMLITQIMQ